MFVDITFTATQVVIDRGPSPYLSNIDLYLDGKLITSVQVKTDRHAIAFLIRTCATGRRTDRVHADGEHSICSGRGGEHDPPKRPCGHGHPHMSTLPLIQVL